MQRLLPGFFTNVPLYSVKGLTPYEQTLYCWLCQYANQSNVCWPSINTLETVCGMSRSMVKKTIASLEKRELLKKTERKDGELNQTNSYQVYFSFEGMSDDEICLTADLQAKAQEKVGHTVTGGRSQHDRGVGHSMTTELNPIELKPKELKETQVSKETALVAQKTYGDPTINGILEAIKEHHGSVDGTKKEARNFSSHLIRKLEDGGVEKEKIPGMVRAVIQKVQETGNAFQIGLTTSPKSLYQNWAKIGVALKTGIKQEQKNAVPKIEAL